MRIAVIGSGAAGLGAAWSLSHEHEVILYEAASKLGVGRKGKPAITLEAGQDVQLCDIAGPGTIRHIWMTTSNNVRLWWLYRLAR